MKIRSIPYTLEMKNTFTISHSSRKTTDTVIVEIESGGITGYGEACLPPYYPETMDSVNRFLSNITINETDIEGKLDQIIDYINQSSKADFAAKAACDIALHDLLGKVKGMPLYELWGIDIRGVAPTSFTLGIDTPENMRKKALGASDFAVLKIKLGSENDRDIVNAIRDVTEKPLRVDINQGWTDRFYALDMIEWLAEHNTELVEQPLPSGMIDEYAWLCEKSPLPLVADESVCHYEDIDKVKGLFHGINIKLMKCGGLREARRMMEKARKENLKIMLGCMTETSCAISAASHLSALADWIDLDGALLVKNDPFSGAGLVDGKIMPLKRPGTGAEILSAIK